MNLVNREMIQEKAEKDVVVDAASIRERKVVEIRLETVSQLLESKIILDSTNMYWATGYVGTDGRLMSDNLDGIVDGRLMAGSRGGIFSLL